MTRTCKKCGKSKSEAEFRAHKRTRDGLSYICNQCKDEIYLPWNSKSQPADATTVYLVAATNGLVKIGCASDIDKRMSLLRCQSPIPVELAYALKCTHAGAIERALHDKFRSQHDHGEWYQLSSDDIEEVKRYAHALVSPDCQNKPAT